MTKSEVAKLVAMLMQAYPNAQVGPATSRLYERMLEDLDAELASAAVERLVMTAKFFPTIAEIRAAAVDLKRGPKRMGAEAWGDVTAAAQRVGQYRPMPSFEDPLVTECVRTMGWQYVCKSDDTTADRARFIEMYDGMRDRERVESQAAHGLLPPANVRTLIASVGKAMP